MSIPHINNKILTIKDFTPAQRFVTGMANRGLGPLILLESFVTGGRTIQAHKRGGFDEARERFTEEAIGAGFWFAGVKVFNYINDYLLGFLMGIKKTDFDAGKDAVRDPLANYLKYLKDAGQKISKSRIAAFKAIKISTSILLANGLVGFVVPKINQSITRAYHANDKKEDLQKQSEVKDKSLMQKFISDSAQKTPNKNFSFQGFNAQTILSLAHKFENDTTYQLLSTDVGISGGRAYSARNNHERIEILWRDLSSIFFYMFSMPLINSVMNLLEHRRPTRLNPVNARQVTDYMKEVLKNTKHHDPVTNILSIDPGTFGDIMLGHMDVTKKMKLFKQKLESGSMPLDEFLSIIKEKYSAKNYRKYSDLAKKMSELQPKVNGVSVLSESQVTAILKGGALNKPEFWDSVFTVTKGIDKNGIANHKNPYKFIAQKDLDEIISNIAKYVKGTIGKAKKQKIDINMDMLEHAYKNNMLKNSINWGTGFAISALFLSTIIPKVQYWITRKTTGSNAFPGTADYSNEKK